MDESNRLKEILLEKSYRKGTFTLTSGKTSDFYIDGKQTTLHAEGSYLCGKLLFELINNETQPIDAVGGMTLGADPLVSAVSIVLIALKLPSRPTRLSIVIFEIFSARFFQSMVIVNPSPTFKVISFGEVGP